MSHRITLLATVIAGMLVGTCAADEVAEELLHWRPVRLGAGGFVTGFVTHPENAAIRYCRTDVGNAYRWDGTEWRPMVVRQGDQGLPAELACAPISSGVDSVAVDPSDPQAIYMALAMSYPDMLGKPAAAKGGNVFRSRDGGKTFAPGNLSVAMEPNGEWRTSGERLKVDPANGSVLYYASLKDGVWTSLDRGETWSRVEFAGWADPSVNVLAVHFDRHSGVVSRGVKRSRVLFAVTARGTVFQSTDGGAAWNDIARGTELQGKCRFSTMDGQGALHVVAEGSHDVWMWKAGKWSTYRVELDYNSTPFGITFDRKNPKLAYAIADRGCVSRTTDGGKSWTLFGPELQFADPLGWLPQKPGWRSNAGIHLDVEGTVWIPQGNEGVLSYRPTGRETSAAPPRWKIDSVGIEEFVTHDVMLPPGGDAVFAVEDATGLVSADVDRFVAQQIPLQGDQLISNGTGLAYCPNAPEYLAIVTADVNYTSTGKSFAGYSPDGGKTWAPFGGLPTSAANGQPLQPAGSIAVGRRDGWGTGADHLVWLPHGEGPTYYSHDGGQTWSPSTGFPLKSGYWVFALKQRLLAADPFTADRFYFVGSWAGGFFVSTDGGKSWTLSERAGLPQFNHHAQLATNRVVKDDLWFCDGWDGSSEHGLWHSSDAGTTFQKLPAVEYAITLAIGKSSDVPGAAPYAVYFYGKLAQHDDWGVFRSTNAGSTWTRMSYFPAGIIDQPTCMAASWDEFGKVIVGFNGNSFVVGSPAAD